MNTRKNLFLFTLLILSFFHNLFGTSYVSVFGDTTNCLIELELRKSDNEDIIVSMIPDTTWEFPNNVVSTAQITIKAPTGQFDTDIPVNLIDGVVFFVSSTSVAPDEAPNFDYISFALGSQGTSKIPFQKGQSVDLFSFSNTNICNNGVISLMDNFTDPFIDNNADINVGQQITVAGYNLADVPVGIRGEGIVCNGEDMVPIDTMDTNPIDSMNTNPIDTMVSISDNLGIQIVKGNISCFGENDGIIVAKGNGGLSPYQYLWNTGDTLSTIENLSEGFYQLTLTDANDEKTVTEVQIESPALLELVINKTENIDIDNPTGTASPIVSGGTSPYQFNWLDGTTDSLRTELGPGDYTLTVLDANGCRVVQSVTINTINCPEIDVMLDMKSPACPGDSTGALRIFPLTGVAPFTFLWETGDTSANLNNIPAGNYMVNVRDNNGCSMTISTVLPDANPIIIDLVVDEGNGDGDRSIHPSITGGAMPYSYIWSDGSSEPTLDNLTTGVFELTLTDDNGCEQIASVVVNPQNCDLGILAIFGQDINLDSVSCLQNGQICLPISSDSLLNYTLLLDGVPYVPTTEGCIVDTFYAYTYFSLPGGGNIGPYALDSWSINGVDFSGEFQNVAALVDSMNTWDVGGNWILKESVFIIEGGIASNEYGTLTISEPLNSASTNLNYSTNLTPTGVAVAIKPGSHTLILSDNRSTCSDTLIVHQPCSNMLIRDTSIIVEVLIGEFDTLNLSSIFGDILSISENECPDLSDGNASIILENTNLTINIEGLIEGADQACYTILDADSITTKVTIQVNVLAKEIDCHSFVELDTFAIQVAGCQDFEICIPVVYDSLINYSITDNGTIFTGVVSSCENENGSLLSFSQPQVHELIVMNIAQCKDTIIIAIHAPACDMDLIGLDTLEVGDDGQTCIEFEGLPTPIESIQDLCPEKNGEMVLIDIDTLSGCINYTAVELGSDTACLEICDVYGFCDTIPVIITVTDSDLVPSTLVAIPDTSTTTINQPVVFNALGNDTFGVLTDMYIVDAPENGIATFNLDGTIQYIPVTDYCNDSIPDIFSYAICDDETNCDTTSVTIFVSCTSDKELTIFTGLSPNGDGKNDVFLIEGIENYPDNSVRIYNRWGNMVMQQERYKNEWSGNWGNGNNLLPDGTYFYIFDTGGGKSYSGFLEIRR